MAASVATRLDDRRHSSVTFSSMTFIERPGMFQVTTAMPSASVSIVKFWNVIRVSVVSLILVLPGGRREITWDKVCRPCACSARRIVADDPQIHIGIFGALVL